MDTDKAKTVKKKCISDTQQEPEILARTGQESGVSRTLQTLRKGMDFLTRLGRIEPSSSKSKEKK